MLAALLLGALTPLPPRAFLPWRETPVARAAARAVEDGQSIVVGTQTLHRCTLVVAGYCGRLRVPLDWLDPSDGTIAIRYQWLPATGAPTARTIAAEEGGPGYSTTGTGAEYRQLFEPVLHDRNLLMMDQRGTGGSAPIDCESLQPFAGYGAPSVSFFEAERQCGAQLNHTYRKSDGRYVHASDLFGSSQSVRDLAAILEALEVGKVDLYGDSYGSFFAQIFAARYPQMLHAVVLDSTYPTLRQDPFDRAGQREIRYGFSVVCRLSIACNADAPGSPLQRIGQLAAALQAKPLRALSATPTGTPIAVALYANDVWSILSLAGDSFDPYRDLDASIRAYLERDDPVPLARLAAWMLDTTYPSTPASYREFSEGLYVADACTVYVNPFDMSDAVATRRMQYAQAVEALEPSFGDPLPNDDVFSSPLEWYNQCLTWPAPVHVDPIVTHPPPLVPPTLPVLVLSGDLDETTSPGDNERAAQQVGSSATLVHLPNSIHVSALLDPYHCASGIVQQFVRNPQNAVQTGCVTQIPEVRTVGIFPLTLANQPPAWASPGNAGSSSDLSLAAVAVEALGDALHAAAAAYQVSSPNCAAGYCGPGLRGGTFAASPSLDRIELHGVAYTADSSVSGHAFVASKLSPSAPGTVDARLVARTNDGRDWVRLTVDYDELAPRAIAAIAGLDERGARIRARLPAP